MSKYLLITCIFSSLISSAQADTISSCPEGSKAEINKVYNPETKQTIIFNCKADGRREFINLNGGGVKILATAFVNEDSSYNLNTYNKYINEQLSLFKKFDQKGNLERKELYQMGSHGRC